MTAAHPVRTGGPVRGPTWPAYAAAVWAVVFGGLSFYWAAGGHLGLGTLHEELQQKALARDEAFIRLVWVTGVLKLVLALLPLALVRHWRLGVPRRLLRVAAWVCGAALVLYGATGMANGALAELGVVDPQDADGARWYLLLWGPVWLTGGLLILASAWRGDGSTGLRRSPARAGSA